MSDKVVDNAAISLVQALADKKWDVVWSLVDPRVVYHETATNRREQGIRKFMTVMREWEEAFPDSKITIGSSKILGNTGVFELQWSGTHDGPIFTSAGVIQPTGKKMEIPVNMVVEFGESETGIYDFGYGDFEAHERETVPPKAEKISFTFDIEAMLKQIELTPEERAA